ncbi:asparaginase [Dysgonomonas sp. 511]|uniref:asparaginase n=1 Tax=Dysgonomonas sp. 511 TaxID=2302930 RepID=UPI0013CF66D7|nr:asparaginase [Dysgonomonas sp. 511]NDV79250.1 asparaginase [Dysgonomonas sp. 511]
MIDVNAHILLIYTGGTIGMVENIETGSLEPFDFAHLNSHIPELQRFRFQVDHIVFNPVIDSSEVTPEHWKMLVRTIEGNYDRYDGFVILHGTDTMSYTASALSFMIENLHKPIVLTGAQLPIGKLRTDAKENLITALEIAADKDSVGNPIVPEVCILFQNDLLRGNRTTKANAENFNAFKSYNYPNLGKSGIQIRYDRKVIRTPDYEKKTIFHYRLDTRIATLKLFPGINKHVVESILSMKNIKGLILETYGSGNAPLSPWFIDAIREIVKKGVIVVNITQCNIGMVDMQRYETGRELLKAGVVSGSDATFETAIAKLMFLIGHKYEKEEIKIRMRVPLVGEMTRTDDKVNEKI